MITESQLLKDRPLEELALTEGITAILSLFQMHGKSYIETLKERFEMDMEEVG